MTAHTDKNVCPAKGCERLAFSPHVVHTAELEPAKAGNVLRRLAKAGFCSQHSPKVAVTNDDVLAVINAERKARSMPVLKIDAVRDSLEAARAGNRKASRDYSHAAAALPASVVKVTRVAPSEVAATVKAKTQGTKKGTSKVA